MTRPVSGEVAAVFREIHGQAIATLVRTYGDIDLAEDSVQDALERALVKWSDSGIPANPTGWVVRTAQRRAVDVARRDSRGKELALMAVAGDPLSTDSPPGQAEQFGDDRLRLLFTCCHPALRLNDQVAMTLRLIGGLRVDEIAAALLVSESALAKRLVRAKFRIKANRIPYRVPSPEELPGRLKAVLAVIYLIYNTGADDTGRAGLRREATRNARDLAALLPEQSEARGLLALLLLNESRIPARSGVDRRHLLSEQDRTRWDRALIEEGVDIVKTLVEENRPGPYQLQAAIQAVHCTARTYEETDWDSILTLYDKLYAFSPTPVVAMNRAIAIGEVHGAQAGLQELEGLGAHLVGYRLWHAARGTYLDKLGERDQAKAAFERALDLATSETERVDLRSRLAELNASQ